MRKVDNRENGRNSSAAPTAKSNLAVGRSNKLLLHKFFHSSSRTIGKVDNGERKLGEKTK